jgi:hypothetical protein
MVYGASRLALQRSQVINGLAERIDHPPQERFAHRHVNHPARCPHDIAGVDVLVSSQQHAAHIALVEVKHQAMGAIGEQGQLVHHHPVQAG